MPDPRPHVVIIGGGFGGLTCARALARAAVRVTVVDRSNHHLFQPLLYQVATAGLSSVDIASPIRKILRHQRNASVLLGEVVGIDADARELRLADGKLGFDHLVVATGAGHSYFGHEAWAPRAPALKTLRDALEIRGRILLAFEAAERETDAARREALLTFVVIGGGPTGVELAGALAEIARHTLARDFRRFDPKSARIVLLEGGARVLPTYTEALSAKAEKQLANLGVTVRTGKLVTEVDAAGVTAGGERIAARTILWAAGVAASPLGRALGVPTDRAGRVHVEPDLTIPGRGNIYVIGDLAHLDQDGRPLPGVAPVAIQMGRHTARNLARTIRGEPRLPFRYKDKGNMATIGRKSAVAQIGRLELWGFPAWVMWLTIHILYLIGFRNRFVVMFEWAWAYFTYQRSARVILEPQGESPPA
jgi:NADH dehydrogenase